jgi:hypothetical protein
MSPMAEQLFRVSETKSFRQLSEACISTQETIPPRPKRRISIYLEVQLSHTNIDVMSAAAPDRPFPNPALADVRAALTVAKKELVKLLHKDTFRRYKQPFVESIGKKYEDFLSSDNETVVANTKRKMKKEEQVYNCKAGRIRTEFHRRRWNAFQRF